MPPWRCTRSPEERPAGHTVGGTTFRDQVGGDLLLAATIGDVGEDEVRIEITVPEGDTVRWSTLCQDAPRDAWTHVDFGARESTSPVRAVTTRTSIREPTGAPAHSAAPGRPSKRGSTSHTGKMAPGFVGCRVRLGLAAYDVAEPTNRVAGYDVPEFLEEDGHLWRYNGDHAVGAGTPEPALRELLGRGLAGAGDRRRLR